MRRFLVTDGSGRVTGEGVRFAGSDIVGDGHNAIRWVASPPTGLVHVRTGVVYPISTSELDEVLEQLHMHMYWIDGEGPSSEPPEEPLS